MDTRSSTALSDMSKQIDELCSSQTQQTEKIRKELGGEITALKEIIEKYLLTHHHPLINVKGKKLKQHQHLQREERTHKQIHLTATTQNTVHQNQPMWTAKTITIHLPPTDYQLA